MHRKIPITIGLIAAFCLMMPTRAMGQENTTETTDEVAWDVGMRASLDAFIPELDNNYYNTGIQVYDITADSVVWQYNGQKVMRPASCQKILTTVTALDALGAGYPVSTKAYYTGKLTQGDGASVPGFLEGDIYIKGGFDPIYSYDDLVELARRVKTLGIDSIAGGIYADVSFKDTLIIGAGWCWDDNPSVYHPFLCPLIFDRGKLIPESNKYPSSNFGFNPAIHFLKTFVNELKKNSVGVDTNREGTLRTRNVDFSKSPVCFYENKRPLEELLMRTMRNSDNLYAEAIFAQLCNISGGTDSEAKDGARVIYNVMKKAGINPTYCQVADGCGLSPYDFVSPAALTAMLRYAYLKPEIIKYLYPALPTAGENGTLEKRMRKGPARDNVHAKTGTVTGVSSLSGYVTASNGHMLAFSIINNGVLKSSTAHDLQDRICQELAK